MSLRCSVKGCITDKGTGDRPMLHSFPLKYPELLKKWLEKIELVEELSSSSRVCSLHFDSNCFENRRYQDRLLPDAIPFDSKFSSLKYSPIAQSSAFYGMPSHSTSDRIHSFEYFVSGLAASGGYRQWKEHWSIFEKRDGICFYRLSRDEFFYNVTMSFKILVNKEMNVIIYKNESEADRSELNWILKVSKLELWDQFYRLLDYYKTEPQIKLNSNPIPHVERALVSLNKIPRTQSITDIIEPIKQQLSSVLQQFNPNHRVNIKVEPLEESEQEDPISFEFEMCELVLKDEMKPEETNEEVAEASFDGNSMDDSMDALEIERPKRKPRRRSAKSRPAAPPVKRPRKNKREPKVEGEVFQCEHCEKICESKLKLKSHFYNKHDGPVFCDICGKKIHARKSLAAHMLRHKDNNRVQCPHCSDQMLPESLRRHIKVRHEGYKPFGCSICGKKFSSTTLVREHEKIHKNKDGTITITKNSCPKCGKRFLRGGGNVDEHIKICQGIPPEKRRQYRYPCTECDRKFVTKIGCAEHMAVDHNIELANVEKFCFECKNEVDNPREHAMTHHGAFKCHLCGLSLTTSQKLEVHMERHQSDEIRPFACDLCPLAFKTSNHLQSHKMAIHTSDEDKLFVCNICNRRYGKQFLLNTHIKQSHLAIKRFSCPFCDKKFKKLHGMKIHCKTDHGEENTYLCADCPMKYKTLTELKNHRQDRHGVSVNVQKFHEA